MLPIQQVSYEEAMKRFRYLYRMENLPSAEVASADWYVSDYACGAIVWNKTRTKARLKGAVVAPESRGQGHGEEMLKHRIEVAKEQGAKSIEVFARHPSWFLRNGFKVKRITAWNITVLELTC